MNLELHIARRIKSGGFTGKKLAGPVIKVATLGIILGMIVMILSISIGIGFKKEIREKVVGFSSAIQLLNYDYNLSYETTPIPDDTTLLKTLSQIQGITHIQKFATKPGLIKTNENIQGIILKGVGADYNWNFFRPLVQKGQLLDLKEDTKSNGIFISEYISNLLHLKVGDKMPMYFIQNKIRARNFTIEGIYNSHLTEFDENIAFVDIKQIQKLNNWSNQQITGYEIQLSDFDKLTDIGDQLHFITTSHIGKDGSMMRVKTIQQSQPQIFGWLSLLDTNIAVIIILIILVAGFNMISGLLILILERTNMIGILKAMGCSNWSIRKTFIYLAGFIIGRGMLLGNFIGIGLCLLQSHFNIIKLDPHDYYLETVPISLNISYLFLLNIAVIALTVLMLIGPSYLASRISPIKAIRFD